MTKLSLFVLLTGLVGGIALGYFQGQADLLKKQNQQALDRIEKNVSGDSGTTSHVCPPHKFCKVNQ